MKSIFTMFLLMLFAVPVNATTYFRHKTPAMQLSPEKRVEYFIRNEATQSDLKSQSFRLHRTIRLRNSYVVRMKQFIDDVEVIGKSIAVEVSKDGRVTRSWGSVLKTRPQALKSVINPLKAIMAVEDALDTILPTGSEAKLFILPFKSPVLVYRVAAWNGLSRYHFYVNAQTGEIVRRLSTQSPALGRVYEIDPARTPATIDATLLNITTDATSLQGHGGLFTVHNCVSAPDSGMGPNIENMELEDVLPSDGEGNYLYEPLIDVVDYTEWAGAVNLYYHVDRMATRFTQLGYTADTALKIVANVHSENTSGVKAPYDNAFYTPLTDGSDMITAGQGTDIDLAYGGDVIMHEFTHSVIAHISIPLETPQFDEYGIARMPLAIHEGLADYFPSSLNDSPVMGAWALEELGGASRDLSNNSKVCPTDMWGEEHMDGEILGAFAWQVREVLGAEDADNIIFESMTRLPFGPTLKDFYDAVDETLGEWVTAGDVTDIQRNDILSVGQTKGLDICGRSIPLEADHTVNNFGLDMLGQMMGADCATVRQYLGPQGIEIPALFQYRLDIPEGTTSITLNPSYEIVQGGQDLEYRIYARTGEMVEYEMVNFMGYIELPRPDVYDMSWPAEGSFETMTTEFTWTIQDDPPLPSGSTVYFAVASMNCPSTTLQIGLTVSDDPITDPDAGVDGGDDADTGTDGGTDDPKDKDGCKCSAGTSSSSTLPYWFIFGIIGMVAFRRKFI
ncbi:hypothetical protein KKF34_12245 [Myxococcota bacterium]|nr:hypothetical protein [Myxococcota bacterium]MBU1379432.1 hypothetical protein [Myxococcota bacterium]MBU1497635.1 hypothetical protein [Myxococcota bacterium]